MSTLTPRFLANSSSLASLRFRVAKIACLLSTAAYGFNLSIALVLVSGLRRRTRRTTFFL